MSGRPTPMKDVVGARPQEMGRIRLGIQVPVKGKAGKTRPQAIETFRFTSSFEDAIRTLADLYGGEPTWDQKHRWWDVTTQAKEVRVKLPPAGFDPLGGTPVYELWSGGGCDRRCDGEQVRLRTVVRTPDGQDVSYDEVPCRCDIEQKLACTPTTRLSVFIPEVGVGGVWQLVSGSWAAAKEMRPMVDTIHAAQARGFVEAKLHTITLFQQGTNKPYTVPRLILSASLDELATQAGPALGAGGSVPPPAAPALPAPSAPDEVADGQLMASDADRAKINGLWGQLTEAQKGEIRAWMAERDIASPADLEHDDAVELIPMVEKMVAVNQEPF